VSVHLNNVLYYAAIVVLVGGFIFGVVFALQARREASEGVDLTSEADMISGFQRSRDAGEMDDAEFRRVRDLLIAGKSAKGAERRETEPTPGVEVSPPAVHPERPPAPGVPE